MNNFVTLNNLQKGIQAFKSQPKWPSDFHNAFYEELNEKKNSGIHSDDLWGYLIDVLAGWKAFRGLSKTEIKSRIDLNLPQVAADYQKILDLYGHYPQIDVAKWQGIQSLFNVASKIRDNQSPVFPSKFCHFLFPSIYLVADRKLIHIERTSYQVYWEQSQQYWVASSEKYLLKSELGNNIKGDIFPMYPWGTKICELCYAGSHC